MSSKQGNFKLYFGLYTILTAIPGNLAYSVLGKFKPVPSKGDVIGVLFALFLITIILPITGLPGYWILLSIYLFFCMLTTLATFRLADEDKEYISQQKMEKKLARGNKKAAKKAGVDIVEEEASTGKYSWEEILTRIENVMVGSGFYKAEDQERNPGYYVGDFFEVVGLEPNGSIEVHLTVPAGKHSADMDRFAELLVTGLNYESAERRTEHETTAGIAKFRVYAEKPETNLRDFSSKKVGEGIFPATEFIDYSAPVDIRNIPIGVMEDKSAGLLTINAFQNHFLIGGSTGGGKSVTGAIIACQIAKTNAIMYGIDLKQVELAMFSDRFAAIAESHDEANIMLDGLIKEMTRRNTYLKSRGATKLSLDDPDNPPIVLLIDEYAELMAPNGSDKAAKDQVVEIDKKVRSLSQLSRNASFSIIIMTQSPKAEIINTQLRNNLMNRIGLYTQTTMQLQTIIGEDANDVELIKPSEQAGWFIGRSYNEPVKFKTIFLEDDERKAIIRKYKGNRRVLKSNAMGEFEAAAWNRFVYRLVEMSDMGMGTLERTKDTVKLANELSVEDGKIIYDYITKSEAFSKIMAEHYGGYEPLDAFVEAYDKRNVLTK